MFKLTQFAKADIYTQLVNLTEPYLGPSSERFIKRQITNHLKKDPTKVNRKDLKVLTDWLRLSMSLITKDEKVINTYIRSINMLSRG